MLKLPDVTLVCYEVVAHDLMTLAVRDAMEKVQFGGVIVWTNKKLDLDKSVQQILVDGKTNKIHSGLVMWYSAYKVVKTTHMLNIEWDAGVHKVNSWHPEFMCYDYIGAPWPWHPSHRVGNGGFSLRSRRLMEYLANHIEWFPICHPDDDALCRRYADALTGIGFKFAPEELADKFSFERRDPHDTFGFHGLFNFPYVFDRDEFLRRVALVPESMYSRPEWSEMNKNAMVLL